MKTTNRKRYEPVTDFERQTSYCPRYLAWHVLDEARLYFRTPVPEAFADRLAVRAEAVFAANSFWQRKYQSERGREAMLTSMRHWLAGVLAKERPALFRDLPDSFKAGHALPVMPRTAIFEAIRGRQIAVPHAGRGGRKSGQCREAHK